MLHRLLPIGLLLLLITYVAFNFQVIYRDAAYKFGFSGDTTTSCCDAAKVAESNGDFDENANTAIFNNEPVDYPKTSLAYAAQNARAATELAAVLGVTTNAAGAEKWIEVSLKDQLLRAWEGTTKVMEFPISSGKWAPTPTGEFRIWYKTRSQSMIGGNPAQGTYYNLSNVPNNLFFLQGYALHGAYWHNNFGQPMSHGCINEPLPNAAQIFDWAGPNLPAGQNAIKSTADNPGTRVVVHK